MSSVTIL